MPQYIGFSTQYACKPKDNNNQMTGVMSSGSGTMNVTGFGIPNGLGDNGQPLLPGKKFTLHDIQLVIQDFVNALNIPLGSKVGQPGYGSNIFNFIFEPNTLDVQTQLENEIRRLASLDPRLDLNSVHAFPSQNGILLEVQISVVPYNNPLTVGVFFNQQTRRATLTAT